MVKATAQYLYRHDRLFGEAVHQHQDKIPSIALVGLMGVGKTTVCQALAHALQRPCIDTDQDIEHYTGKTIKELFQYQGEQAFRVLEYQIIKQRLEEPRCCVMALGGGAFMDFHTRLLIKYHTFSIWLRATLQTMLQRTYPYHDRPLLATKNPKDTLTHLIAQRYPFYAQTNIVLDTDDVTTQEIVVQLLALLVKHP